MNRDTLLGLYDRFAGLLEKLPGGLQKPILRELTPIRETFLDQRPARLLLLGSPGHSALELLHTLTGVPLEIGASENGWRTYTLPGRGSVTVLDARTETPDALFDSALAFAAPDLAVLITSPGDAPSPLEATRLASCDPDLPLLGVALGDASDRSRLAARIQAEPRFARRKNTLCAPHAGDLTAESLCALLPNGARLEFARLSNAREAQRQIAGSLLKSFTAVCGVIGLQPIPLADMPVLTALQTLMVGLIIYTTGKPVSPRLFAEFLGALGFNIGVGLLFREGARAVIKVVPLWGNAVSGMVAGAGTYAIGHAAIAYFIDGVPLSETKKLFRRLLPAWGVFRRKSLPAPQDTPPPLPDQPPPS